MENIGLVILVTIVALVIFMLGMSLTLIFKGHHIKSEIGDNENMRALGIKCVVRQMREEEKRAGKEMEQTCGLPSDCTQGVCGTCPEIGNADAS